MFRWEDRKCCYSSIYKVYIHILETAYLSCIFIPRRPIPISSRNKSFFQSVLCWYRSFKAPLLPQSLKSYFVASVYCNEREIVNRELRVGDYEKLIQTIPDRRTNNFGQKISFSSYFLIILFGCHLPSLNFTEYLPLNTNNDLFDYTSVHVSTLNTKVVLN